MRTITDISYAPYPETLLDLYLPDSGTFPVFVFFHGGGMETGDRTTERDVFEELARSGIAVVSADYRMYPSARYPQFIEDAASCVHWAARHIGEYGACEGIYVSGSSAGAYLAMMLCFDGRWLGRYGLSSADLAGFVFDSGQPTTHFNVLRERGVDVRRVLCDEAAPLYHVGEQESLPPLLVLVTDRDIPNRLEQTQLLVSTLAQFGFGADLVTCLVLQGYEHTEHLHTVKDGENVFVRLVREFVERTESRKRKAE